MRVGLAGATARMDRVRGRRVAWVRWCVALVVGGLVVAGCGGGGPSAGPTESPSPALTESRSPLPTSPSPTPGLVEEVEFVYELPEEPCPSPSALPSLPGGGDAYVLRSSSPPRPVGLKVHCNYQWAEIGEGEEDMILADHVLVTSELILYEDRSDAGPSKNYPEVPWASADLTDWVVNVFIARDRGVWWEGCGPTVPCPQGGAPGGQTHAYEVVFEANLGNLEFYVVVIYIAREIPSEVVRMNVEIFRELVLAVMADWERVS